MKKALVTGISGQDGSYLAEILLEKGYEVWGLIRHHSSELSSLKNINHIRDDLHLIEGDLVDYQSLRLAFKKSMPDELYNLAAQSHVRVSFDMPEYTSLVNGGGVQKLLDIIHKEKPDTKFYQASTSEIMGNSKPPQNEASIFEPRSPYGNAKLQGYWHVKNYREGYNIFASNGILFNHESPRRSESFVTRKIAQAVRSIYVGELDCLYLGNLDARRDWGYAKDFCEAMYLIMQHDKPEDFVVATGVDHSVRDMLEKCFAFCGIEIESNGLSGIEEVYIDKKNGQEVVRIDPQFFRPTEVNHLLGDYTKAKEILGWEPKTSFDELIEIMMTDSFNEK